MYACATDQKVIDSIEKSASMYPCVKEIRHINELIQPCIERLRDSFKPIVINNICDLESREIFEAKWHGFENHDPFAIYDVIFNMERENGTLPIRESYRFPAEQDIISTLKNRTDRQLILVGITEESVRMIKAACIMPNAFLRRDDRAPVNYGILIPEVTFEEAVDKYQNAYFYQVAHLMEKYKINSLEQGFLMAILK